MKLLTDRTNTDSTWTNRFEQRFVSLLCILTTMETFANTILTACYMRGLLFLQINLHFAKPELVAELTHERFPLP